MSRVPRRIPVAAAAVGVAAIVGLSSPAYASSSSGSDLTALKARAAAAISLRQSALQKAVTDVGANRYLTGSDRSTILSVLTSDQADLTALGATIAADQTYTQAQSDYRSIFTVYRVFALRLPQARFAASADDLTGTVLPRLTDAQSRLQALLSGADAGKNTPAVQALMSDLAAQIGAVSSNTNGLSATVLAITPAQYDANPSVLAGPRTHLGTARSAARQADHDIASVVADLQ